MPAPPLVSVIIPVYNAEKFIRDTISQIKAQTLENFECILIDDSSTDDSASAISKAIKSDSRFTLLKHAKNMGKVFSLNEGITISKGRFIQFLDDDDIYDQNMLLECSQVMERDGLDILCSNYSTLDLNTNAKNLKELRNLESLSNQVFSLNTLHTINDTTFYLSLLSGVIWSKMFSREFLRRNEIVFREFFPSDDIVFCAEAIIKASRIGVLDHSFVTWRVCNDQSASGQQDKYADVPIQALQKVKELLISSANYDSKDEKVLFEQYVIIFFKKLLSLNYQNTDTFNEVYRSTRELLNKTIVKINNKYDNELRDILIECERLDDFLLRAYRLTGYENQLITTYNESLIHYWKNELGSIPKTWRYKLFFLLPRKICQVANIIRKRGKR